MDIGIHILSDIRSSRPQLYPLLHRGGPLVTGTLNHSPTRVHFVQDVAFKEIWGKSGETPVGRRINRDGLLWPPRPPNQTS